MDKPSTLRSTVVEVSETGVDIQLVDQDGRAMANAGSAQPDERLASGWGKGDTEPLINDNPYRADNRRVGIVRRADAPALP